MEESSVSAVNGDPDEEESESESIEINFEHESDTTTNEDQTQRTRPTVMTRNTRFSGALKDMEWFGESPSIWNLGRTRSESRKSQMEEEDTTSGPYYIDVERTTEDMANMILEAISREPIKEFLEPRNLRIVDAPELNYNVMDAVDDLPEPGENVMGPEGLKPEQYKDVYMAPRSFQEAWNHPDAFQRKM